MLLLRRGRCRPAERSRSRRVFVLSSPIVNPKTEAFARGSGAVCLVGRRESRCLFDAVVAALHKYTARPRVLRGVNGVRHHYFNLLLHQQMARSARSCLSKWPAVGHGWPSAVAEQMARLAEQMARSYFSKWPAVGHGSANHAGDKVPAGPRLATRTSGPPEPSRLHRALASRRRAVAASRYGRRRAAIRARGSRRDRR